MDIDLLIRKRRSHHRFDGQLIPRKQLAELAELLCWAPNHKMTQPWRCIALEQPAVQRLAEFTNRTPPGAHGLDRIGRRPVFALSSRGCTPSRGGPRQRRQLSQLRREKKYRPSTGCWLISCQNNDDQLRQFEDIQACAAGVQNILLAAEARGPGGFWSTGKPFRLTATQRWLGLNPDTEMLIAAIWLGGPSEQPTPPARHHPYLTWLAEKA